MAAPCERLEPEEPELDAAVLFLLDHASGVELCNQPNIEAVTTALLRYRKSALRRRVAAHVLVPVWNDRDERWFLPVDAWSFWQHTAAGLPIDELPTLKAVRIFGK